MDLSISIVSWNVREHVRTCLQSVYNSVNNLSFEIIAVDNNSRDGTAEMLKDEFPNVQLIENKENLGFAAASNQAIKQAKGRYILLLNPDTIIPHPMIEEMVHSMNSHPNVGISSCRKINQNGDQDSLDLFIGRYDPFYFFRPRNFLKTTVLRCLTDLFPNSKSIKSRLFNAHTSISDFSLCNGTGPIEVNVVWGCFMMIRRELVEHVGGFDERFFFTVEDMDLCYRAKKAGWKIHFFPQYEIVHIGQKSINQWDKKREIADVLTYSHFLFYSKHKGKVWLFFRAFNIICVDAVIAVVLLIVNFFRREDRIDMKNARNSDLCNVFAYIRNSLDTVLIDIRNLVRAIFNIPLHI